MESVAQRWHSVDTRRHCDTGRGSALQGQVGAMLSCGTAKPCDGNDCLAALRHSAATRGNAKAKRRCAQPSLATAMDGPAMRRRSTANPRNGSGVLCDALAQHGTATALQRKATRGQRETKPCSGLAQRSARSDGSASHGLAAAWIGRDGAARRRQSTPALSKGKAEHGDAAAKHGAACDGEAGRSQAMRRRSCAKQRRSKASNRTDTWTKE